MRGVIEDCSQNCRFIFTCNDLKKIHPALCSRLLSICFDMTSSQQTKSLELYTKRTVEKLKTFVENIDENRITRIISMYYPDYRTIANHLEYEFI